jgi:hypothetical protein
MAAGSVGLLHSFLSGKMKIETGFANLYYQLLDMKNCVKSFFVYQFTACNIWYVVEIWLHVMRLNKFTLMFFADGYIL